MNPEYTFALFQLVIIVPFLLGSLLSQRVKDLGRAAKKIILVNLTFIEPPIILWSIWGLTLSAEMVLLPFSGLTVVVLGFVFGKIFVGKLDFDRKAAKSYVICSSLANNGFTMGGFLCYLFAGEKGLGLSAIFILFFIPYTFLFIFPYAGTENRRQVLKWSFVRSFLFTPRNMPVYAVIAAIIIRSNGFERPDIDFPLEILLIVSISLYYFTLGINFKPADLNPLKKENFLLAVQKFIVLPATIFLVFHFIPIGDDLKLVIKLQSFMPVAVYSVIASIMFDLDARRASSMFVVNSLVFIVLVLPLLFLAQDVLF